MIPRWRDCVVVAPGPSFTEAAARQCRRRNLIAVNDAWRLAPFADILYAADAHWWDLRGPTKDEFKGDRWSVVGEFCTDNKILEKRGIHLAKGANEWKFGRNGMIHYGSNSGFQAVNLAIEYFGARHITLVGFDMRLVEGVEHFWGNYQAAPFHAPDFAMFLSYFEAAAKAMPDGVRIVNATPGSALNCFPKMSYAEAVDDCRKSGGISVDDL